MAGNYADTTAQIIAPNGTDPSNVVASNSLGLTSWPAAAQTIMAGAGLEPAWAGIRGGPSRVNLAVGAPAYSGTAALLHGAAAANDGDSSTAWVSAAGDPGPWWEVDLGAQYTLTTVSLLTRQDSDQLGSQSGFEVWVSNTASMASGYTVACVADPAPIPFRETWVCTLPAGPWQYLAVVQPGAAGLAISELRVYGHA